MITLWARDRLSGRHLKRKTREYLDKLELGPVIASRSAASELLKKMGNEPGPKISVGKTMWGEPVNVPLLDLVKACGLTTGGMGAGKTMFAMLPIAEMIRLLPGLKNMSFGVLDAKGELFERALYLLGARLAELRGEEREALARRIVVIDFSSREAVSPYNILARWPYTDGDFFVTSRLETLRELLPAGEKLSLRGAAVLKNILMLLAEFNLPLTYLEAVLADDAFRQKLLLRSKNAAVRSTSVHARVRKFIRGGIIWDPRGAVLDSGVTRRPPQGYRICHITRICVWRARHHQQPTEQLAQLGWPVCCGEHKWGLDSSCTGLAVFTSEKKRSTP